MDGKLIVSSSPHLSSTVKTRNIMLDVIIAMVPALIASVFYFGPRALALVVITVAACVISEYISRKVMKREQTIGDLSAVVTGMLLAFNYPATLPFWIAAIGGVVAIVMVKQMFGGLGHNFANPAITARIILMTSFALRTDNMDRSICMERRCRCNFHSDTIGIDLCRQYGRTSYIYADVSW